MVTLCDLPGASGPSLPTRANIVSFARPGDVSVDAFVGATSLALLLRPRADVLSLTDPRDAMARIRRTAE